MENLRIDAKTRDADSLVRKWPTLADIDLLSKEPSEVAVIIGADQPAALEILEYRRDPLNHRVTAWLVNALRLDRYWTFIRSRRGSLRELSNFHCPRQPRFK